MKISGMKELQKNIDEIAKQYPAQANKSIYVSLLKIIAESDKNVNVDEGHLRSSSYVTPLSTIQRDGVGYGGYSSDYAIYVHEGTTGHYVPIEPLMAWVQRKGIASGSEAENVAYAIQKSIAKNGTKAYKFLEIALNEVLPSIKGDIASELKALERKFKA